MLVHTHCLQCIINGTVPLVMLRVTPVLLLLRYDKSKCRPREMTMIKFSAAAVHVVSKYALAVINRLLKETQL